MTPTAPDTVETDAEFERALGALVRAAHESGVDVRSGWEARAARTSWTGRYW